MTSWASIMLKDLGPILTSNNFLLQDFAIPFTVFAAVGVANAVNMLDGVDGLAASVSLTVLGIFCLLSLATLHTNFYLMLILMAVLAGYLYYNLPVAKNRTAFVFMGDAGSLFIGFVLSWLFVAETQEPNRILSPVTALWVFGIPLFDTVSLMARRMFEKKSPFKADRAHLHHILQALGCSSKQIVLVAVSGTLVLSSIGIVTEKMGVPDYIMFYLFLLTFSIYYAVSKHWVNKLRLATASVFEPVLKSVSTDKG